MTAKTPMDASLAAAAAAAAANQAKLRANCVRVVGDTACLAGYL